MLAIMTFSLGQASATASQIVTAKDASAGVKQAAAPVSTPVVSAPAVPNAATSPTDPTKVPHGTVQFRIDGAKTGSPVTLNPSSQAGYVTSTLAVGRHTVSAVYTSTGNFNPSNSGNITQRIR